MLIINPDLLNSCRVCRSPNQDGEYESLYIINSQRMEEKPELSEAGILYESLLDISLNMWNYYPQFLCNSCDLQMKLFKKLKDKAYKTLEYLQSLHEKEEFQTDNDVTEEKHMDIMEEPSELEEEHVVGENFLNESVEKENYAHEKTIREDELDNYYKEESFPSDRDKQIDIFAIGKDELLVTNSHYIEENKNADPETYENQNLLRLSTKECTDSQLKEVQLLELTEGVENEEDKMSELKLELDTDSVIDKNDYVTEIYVTNNESFIENSEVLEDYDVYEESNTETSSVFNDVEYVLEETTEILQEQEEDLELKIPNPTKKRKTNENNVKKKEYKCGPCQSVFKSTQEYKNHRIQSHNEKYPCSVCSKEMKSNAALHTHMKLHSDKPAYQCKICQKEFRQKSHFQYHMNHHNNVRNFKCEKCEKAFLSKSDLKIHMRSHTGQRPYVCNICGKDYLMMEHLKTHALIHSQESFQCDVCLRKFATHKTLRTHITTIHEDEPRFKCSYCAKAFRRKHHLDYHLRLHLKNVTNVENGFEVIDQDDCQELVDELVDDPGFIAL